MTYRIQKADTSLDEVADELRDLQRLCFGNTAPMHDPEYGQWWLCKKANETVGFCALRESMLWSRWGFLMLAGVLPAHQGQGLQRRMIRVREREAKALGFEGCITYTIDNPASANNLIRCGYKLYKPAEPYANNKAALYWRRYLC